MPRKKATHAAARKSAQVSPAAFRNRRLMLGWAVAAVAAVLFGIGFSLGWFQPSAGPDGAESPHAQSSPAASNLADLLPGLEAKVAANPKDMELRLLLAQTYGELGQREQSIKEFRIVHKADPKNTQVIILLATALMEGDSKNDWQEAYKLLDEAVRLKPAVLPMARLYQGDILVKLGDKPGAIKLWNTYLAQSPADDQRRAMFQERLAQVSGSSR